MGNLLSVVIRVLYRVLRTILCCRPKHHPSNLHDPEKSPGLPSPATTRASTNISQLASSPLPFSPSTAEHHSTVTATPSSTNVFQTTSPPPQTLSAVRKPPSDTEFNTTSSSRAPATKPPAVKDKQAKNTTIADLNKLFQEARLPDNDGSDLPWPKTVSSPAAAARYLDDVAEGH